VSRLFGLHHGAGCLRPHGQNLISVDRHRLGQGRGEAVTAGVGLGADILIVTVKTVPAAITTGGAGAGARLATLLEVVESVLLASGDVLEELHPHSASRTPATSKRLIS
jgi:hypothetical protein